MLSKSEGRDYVNCVPQGHVFKHLVPAGGALKNVLELLAPRA